QCRKKWPMAESTKVTQWRGMRPLCEVGGSMHKFERPACTIVVVDGEEGLLELKCLPSKKGLTAEEACKDPKFCCKLEDGGRQCAEFLPALAQAFASRVADETGDGRQ
ncbi:hypothetical protein HPB47_005945, partial [Ixodes persulcatus]